MIGPMYDEKILIDSATMPIFQKIIVRLTQHNDENTTLSANTAKKLSP